MRSLAPSLILAVAGALLASTALAEPLSLRDAMDMAVRATPDAALIQTDAALAEAHERSAFGALIPTGRATVSSVRNEEEISLGDRAFVSLWAHSARIRISADLFRGTAVPDWRSAHWASAGAQERASWAFAGLRLDAARAYLAALTAAANLEAARQSITVREASLEQAAALDEAGYAVAADVARARFALVEAETAELDAEQGLSDALAALAFRTGRDDVDAADLTMPVFDTIALDSTTGSTADGRALDLEIAAATVATTGQWLSFLPVLSVAGQYDVGPSTVRAPDGTTWLVSFTAAWDFLDYTRYGRLDAARATEDAAELRRAQWLREREYALSNARRAISAARQRLVLAEEALLAATETRSYEFDRFSGGDSTVFDLVSADADLYHAEVRRNVVRLDAALTHVEYAYLLGELEDDGWLE